MSRTDDLPPRIYLITPPQLDPEPFAADLARLLDAAPVACLRLRLGTDDEDAWRVAANHLLPVCHEREIALVIDDHFRMVEPLGLDGVHLSQPRASVRKVRKALGEDRIVGAFGGASRHDAMNAAEAGADYVSLGPVRAGALGDGAEADAGLFAWWAEMIETPCVAEGGLTPEIAATLSETTDFVAPCRSVWEAEDPAGVLRAYASALA